MTDKPVYSSSGSGRPLYQPTSGKPVYTCGSGGSLCCGDNTEPDQVQVVFSTLSNTVQCSEISGGTFILTKTADPCTWSFILGSGAVLNLTCAGGTWFLDYIVAGFGGFTDEWSLPGFDCCIPLAGMTLTDVNGLCDPGTSTATITPV